MCFAARFEFLHVPAWLCSLFRYVNLPGCEGYPRHPSRSAFQFVHVPAHVSVHDALSLAFFGRCIYPEPPHHHVPHAMPHSHFPSCMLESPSFSLFRRTLSISPLFSISTKARRIKKQSLFPCFRHTPHSYPLPTQDKTRPFPSRDPSAVPRPVVSLPLDFIPRSSRVFVFRRCPLFYASFAARLNFFSFVCLSVCVP